MLTITQLILSSWLSKCKHEVMIHSQQQLTPGISSSLVYRLDLKSAGKTSTIDLGKISNLVAVVCTEFITVTRVRGFP